MPKYICHPADTVMVFNKVGLSHIAANIGMDAEELQFLNPSLKKNMVPVTATGYALKLPISKIGIYAAMKDSIFKNMPDPEQELLARSEVTAQLNAGSTGSAGKSKLYYTVKSGDNLGYISEWYDCTPQQIRNWNGIYGNTIRVGQKLSIYVPKEKHDNYLDVNSMSLKEKQEWKSSGGAAVSVKRDESCNCVYYKVRAGDTLWDISQRYQVTVDEIKRHNKVSESELKPGMVLKIILG